MLLGIPELIGNTEVCFRKFFSGTLKTTICHKFDVPEVKNLMKFKCEQDRSYTANCLKHINH